MKRNAKPNTIIFRLDDDNFQNLEILQTATGVDKSKIIRMILKNWFNDNEKQIDEYYEKTKTN